MSTSVFYIGDAGVEWGEDNDMDQADGGAGQEWFVDWTNLDNQHTACCVEDSRGASAMNCALIDNAEHDALGVVVYWTNAQRDALQKALMYG